MKKKLFVLTTVVSCLLICSSCEKTESIKKDKENSNDQLLFVISRVDTIPNVSKLKSSSSQWGSYLFATNTYNRAQYFSAGTYAVKISRNSDDGQVLNMRLEVQDQTSLKNAYVWAYKNDANNNQLYYSGLVKLAIGESSVASPIQDLSITGSQYIIYVFKVVSSGNYIFCYRKMS